MTTVEGTAVQAHPLLAEEDGAAILVPDHDGDGRSERAQEKEPQGGADHVHEPLHGQGQGPVGPGDQREDGDAVQVLDLAGGEGMVQHVHRHADDLSLLLADPGDRVDQVPLREREADGDLVDHALVEDGRKVFQPAKQLPVRREREVLVVDEARDPQPQLRVLSELRGERLAPRARADEHDEPGVVAATAQPAKPDSERRPRRQGEDELGGEQQQQEQPADVRDLEEEEHADREQRHQQRGAGKVARLRPDAPAGAWTVEAVEREHGHPPPGVQRQEGERLGNHEAPPDRPVRAETQDGQHHEQGDGQEAVDQHEQRAEPVGVAPDHCPRSLGKVVRPGNGTEGSPVSRGGSARLRSMTPPRTRVGIASGRGHRARLAVAPVPADRGR